ncbi:MAG: diguanylate cyclase [Ignavibacteriales bacterium]
MFSDYLTRVKLAINEVAKATTEPEVYKYLTEALINHFGFNRATVRKVNWERSTLSLVCYVGFIEEVPRFKLPLSEESGATGRAVIRGEGVAVFEREEVSPEPRLSSKFAGLQKVACPHSFVVIPIKVKGRVWVVFEVDRKTSGGIITLQDKEILDLFSETVGTALERVLVQEELKATLIRDELTGLFNKRYFTNRLSEEYERAKRYGVPLSLCIFDIDNFKLINDTYGHIFGDQVLKQVGRLTSETVRHVDIAARYGGEEFTVLFTHTTLENAVIIAERIHRAISTLIFPYNEKEIQVTATFGISAYSSVNVREPKELLHHADMALYEGKKRYDKNCVVTYTESGYKILEKGKIRLEPIPQIQEVEIKEGTAAFKMLHESNVEKKRLRDFTSLQIIPPAISKNLRNQYQMTSEFMQSLNVTIRELRSILPLIKSNSFALLSLSIVLPMIIFFVFGYEKGHKSISPPHYISTPDNGSSQLRLALIETLHLDGNSEETLKEATPFRYIEFEERMISSKQTIQGISNKLRTSGKKRLLAKHKIHSQPRSSVALPVFIGEEKPRISPQIILASDSERKKELLTEQLRRVFLLYH